MNFLEVQISCEQLNRRRSGANAGEPGVVTSLCAFAPKSFFFFQIVTVWSNLSVFFPFLPCLSDPVYAL